MHGLPHSQLTERAPDLVGSVTELKENRLMENLLVDVVVAPAAAGGGSCSRAVASGLLLLLFVRPPILLSTFFMVLRLLTIFPRAPYRGEASCVPLAPQRAPRQIEPTHI